MSSVERFGEYELVRYLAAGGMADLYLARSPHWRELLVVKRIQQRYLDHTRVVKMFIDEGRIAQLLDHPNIVRVVDVGREAATYYIAMEYIPGHDLIALVRRGIETGRFVPRHLAVAIVAQVASGLAFAHTRTDEAGNPLNIVHCDISPGNIVVSLRGTAKVVDFGIARATIALREEDGVAGKYNYMAPEQIRGASVDERSDLFALGVILYELTVGKRLFKGPPPAVMRMVCEEPVTAPTQLRPDFSPELERIILRLLEKNPDDRYPSAIELRVDLRAWLASCGEPTTKRDLARYLHELFRAPRQNGSVEDEETLQDMEDEELELERAMPEVAPHLEVDPEEDDARMESALVGDRSVSTPWGLASLGLGPVQSQRPPRNDETPLPPPRPPAADPFGETGMSGSHDATVDDAPTERHALVEPEPSRTASAAGAEDVSFDEPGAGASEDGAPSDGLFDERTERASPLPRPTRRVAAVAHSPFVDAGDEEARRRRRLRKRRNGPELIIGIAMLVLSGLLLALYFYVNH